MEMNKIAFTRPASVWNEALPIGSGRLGGMIYGQVEREHIQLNEDSIWYGKPMDRNNPDALKYLPDIRRLIVEGKTKEAEELIKFALSGTPQSQRMYQSLGDLHINMDDHNEAFDQYLRVLDIGEAIHRVTYEHKKKKYKREMFATGVDQVIALKLSCDEKASINCSILLTRERYYNQVVKYGNDTLILDGSLGRSEKDFCLALKVITDGGSCQVIGEHLIVRQAHAATILISAGSDFRYNDLEKDLISIIDKAASFTYEDLKQRHIRDYQSLYNRMSLNIREGIQGSDTLMVDKEKPSLESKDLLDSSIEFFFNYGRYLMIASSRPGSLPSNLQGIWNNEMAPPWDSKYTININTEMNYWMAEMCNLAECHHPLFDLIERMVPNGSVTARQTYGCRGFVAHHNTDIWGDTSVQDICISSSYWVMGAGWLCTHFWRHYDYTRDLNFLKRVFPIMLESAYFFLDFLYEEDGFLITNPSLSPENSYYNEKNEIGTITRSATMDNQILHDLFDQCIKAGDLLGEKDKISEIVEAIHKIPSTKIGPNQCIMEWEKPYKEVEPGHRHLSHLYGLYPSSQINVYDTPELARAAKESIEKRLSGGGGHTGWSRSWIINLYARLQDADLAYENLLALIRESTQANFLVSHPPFQIDGNFGGVAGIVEMLIQSYSDRCILLAALPKSWKKGQISGVRIRGNGYVDLSWSNSRLESCHIHAKESFRVKMVYRNQEMDVNIEKGKTLHMELDKSNRLRQVNGRV